MSVQIKLKREKNKLETNNNTKNIKNLFGAIEFNKEYNILKGINFCKVISNKKIYLFIFSNNLINQNIKGNKPILIKRIKNKITLK
jgi:hypothetical protein